MKLQFSAKALATYNAIKLNSPDLSARIKEIIKDAMLHPETGIGNPIGLEGEFKGVWQRKISHNEYLNYVFNDEVLVIASINVNESSQKLSEKGFSIESFTEDEYKSVMDLMASNRGKDKEPKVGIFWYNKANSKL